MISKCSKLAQKENKTRHNWVGKVIHWEMSKKFKFDPTKNGICTTQHLSSKITHINSYGLRRTDGSPNLGKKTKPYNNQQQKKNLQKCRRI